MLYWHYCFNSHKLAVFLELLVLGRLRGEGGSGKILGGNPTNNTTTVISTHPLEQFCKPAKPRVASCTFWKPSEAPRGILNSSTSGYLNGREKLAQGHLEDLRLSRDLNLGLRPTPKLLQHPGSILLHTTPYRYPWLLLGFWLTLVGNRMLDILKGHCGEVVPKGLFWLRLDTSPEEEGRESWGRNIRKRWR